MPYTVLVVNDDAIDMLITVSLLETADHRVLRAFNGRQAIEQCLKSPPDLVVTDIDMPEMNGLEAARELRRLADIGRLPRIPILATSAAMSEERRRDCQEAGIRQAFGKPMDFRTLLEAVASACEGR